MRRSALARSSAPPAGAAAHARESAPAWPLRRLAVCCLAWRVLNALVVHWLRSPASAGSLTRRFCGARYAPFSARTSTGRAWRLLTAWRSGAC